MLFVSGNVSQAQLCIGENGSDVVVNEYHDMSAVGGTGAASVGLNAMFDSTHFKDGAKIKITLKAWDTNGGNYETEVTGPAYNKAYVLTNNTLPSYIAERETMFDGLPSTYHGHSTSESYDNSTFILNRLPSYSVFYIHTHANSDGFGDCNYNGGGDVVDYTGGNSVASVLNIGKVASSGIPPYNFVVVNGCNSASSYEPSGRFLQGSGASGFQIQGKDRAFLGTQDFTPTDDFPWAEAV